MTQLVFRTIDRGQQLYLEFIRRSMVVSVLRGLVVPIILVLAVAIALASISYPSMTISNVTTQSLAALETYSSQYETGYPQLTASTILTGYSSFTAWYPGNPICDPTSNACTPYPTPTATFVYPQSMTYTYEVTLSSQGLLAYTSPFTMLSTQTSFANVPPYAALGLTELQYGLAAMIFFAIAVSALLFILTKKRPTS